MRQRQDEPLAFNCFKVKRGLQLAGYMSKNLCKVALFNSARKQVLGIISISEQSSWNVAVAKVTMWPHPSPPQHPGSGVSVQDGSRKTPLYTAGDFNVKMDIFLSLTICLLLPLPDDRFKKIAHAYGALFECLFSALNEVTVVQPLCVLCEVGHKSHAEPSKVLGGNYQVWFLLFPINCNTKPNAQLMC